MPEKRKVRLTLVSCRCLTRTHGVTEDCYPSFRVAWQGRVHEVNCPPVGLLDTAEELHCVRTEAGIRLLQLFGGDGDHDGLVKRQFAIADSDLVVGGKGCNVDLRRTSAAFSTWEAKNCTIAYQRASLDREGNDVLENGQLIAATEPGAVQYLVRAAERDRPLREVQVGASSLQVLSLDQTAIADGAAISDVVGRINTGDRTPYGALDAVRSEHDVCLRHCPVFKVNIVQRRVVLRRCDPTAALVEMRDFGIDVFHQRVKESRSDDQYTVNVSKRDKYG